MLIKMVKLILQYAAPADVFDHLGSTFIITFVRTSHASNHRTDDEDQVNAEEHEGRGKQQALTGWHGHLYDVRGRRLQGAWLNCGVLGPCGASWWGFPAGMTAGYSYNCKVLWSAGRRYTYRVY